jgi:hypothetical protein
MPDDAKARIRELLRNPTRRYVTGILSLCAAIALAGLFWLLRTLW